MIQVTAYNKPLTVNKETLEYLINTLKTDHSDVVIYGIRHQDGELAIAGMYFLKGEHGALVSDVLFMIKGNRLYYLLYHPDNNVPKTNGAGDKFFDSFRFVENK